MEYHRIQKPLVSFFLISHSLNSYIYNQCKCEFQGGISSPGKLRTMLLGVDRKPKEVEDLHSTFTSRSHSSSYSPPPCRIHDAGSCFASSFISFCVWETISSLLYFVFIFSALLLEPIGVIATVWLAGFLFFIFLAPGKCFPSGQSVPFGSSVLSFILYMLEQETVLYVIKKMLSF